MNLTFGEVESVQLSEIDADQNYQARAETYEDSVEEYARDLEAGDEFSAVMLVRLSEGKLVPADGFTRIAAFKKTGRVEIPAKIADGTIDDVLGYGATVANRTHGRQPNRADKRRRASLALRHPELSSLSDRELGRRIGVSHTAIAKYRDLPLGKPTIIGPGAMQTGCSYWLEFDDGQHGFNAELAWQPEHKKWLFCYIHRHDDKPFLEGEISVEFRELCLEGVDGANTIIDACCHLSGSRLIRWSRIGEPGDRPFALFATMRQLRKYQDFELRLHKRHGYELESDPDAYLAKLPPTAADDVREAVADRSLDEAVAAYMGDRFKRQPA